MRQTNIDLVNTYKPIGNVVDVGGYGDEARWDFPYKVLDVHEGSDYIVDITKKTTLAEEFDYVICIDTPEHVARPWDAVRNMEKMLKKGGTLILSTVFVWGYHKYPEDYYRFTVPALEDLCSSFDKIDSGWQSENVPLDGENGSIHITLPHAGVYFVGRKR